MKTKVGALSLVCAIGFMALTAPIGTVAAENIQRTVRGVVTAINTTADPQTIVVKVMLPNKEDLIVGARVPADAKVARGKHAAKLPDLKVGETVAITYLKSPDGLTAQSIHVR
jgi:hypothetical protein